MSAKKPASQKDPPISSPPSSRKRSVGESVDMVLPSPPSTTRQARASPVSERPTKMPKTIDKGYKGLRHFSMMVCKKVEEKGTTSYNEVADELVTTVIAERQKEQPAQATPSTKKKQFDEKNIRRRVYDALNVLMAMDIITKDKKEITWKGLPTTASQDLELMRRELHFRRSEVERKKEALRELLVQQVCFRNLVELNHKREEEQRVQEDRLKVEGKTKETDEKKKDNKIPLPFIVVNTHSSAVIQCNMSRDLTDVMFDFSMPFEINDDNTILKRLGLQRSTEKNLREMLPQDLFEYCQNNNLLDQVLPSAVSGEYPVNYAAPAAAPVSAPRRMS